MTDIAHSGPAIRNLNSLKISGQKAKILAYFELETNKKYPSTTEDMPVGARRFEEFLQ